MDEYVSVVSRFADDLCAVGIPRRHLGKVMCLYMSALSERTDVGWAFFYRHVSELLQHWCGDPCDPDAAQRLLALVDDDFGQHVLELPDRARLRELLSEHRIAS